MRVTPTGLHAFCVAEGVLQGSGAMGPFEILSFNFMDDGLWTSRFWVEGGHCSHTTRSAVQKTGSRPKKRRESSPSHALEEHPLPANPGRST